MILEIRIFTLLNLKFFSNDNNEYASNLLDLCNRFTVIGKAFSDTFRASWFLLVWKETSKSIHKNICVYPYIQRISKSVSIRDGAGSGSETTFWIQIWIVSAGHFFGRI